MLQETFCLVQEVIKAIEKAALLMGYEDNVLHILNRLKHCTRTLTWQRVMRCCTL